MSEQPLTSDALVEELENALLEDVRNRTKHPFVLAVKKGKANKRGITKNW